MHMNHSVLMEIRGQPTGFGLVLFFHNVGLGDLTSYCSIGTKCLYPLSHPTGRIKAYCLE